MLPRDDWYTSPAKARKAWDETPNGLAAELVRAAGEAIKRGEVETIPGLDTRPEESDQRFPSK